MRARTHTIYVYIWAVSTHHRTQICSYQSERRALTKRNRQKHSYGCNMYCTEQQRIAASTATATAFKMETTERDNYLNLYFVGGYECKAIDCVCVLCTVSHRSYSCCIVVGIAWFSLVLLVICSAVALCASHYLQLRSARLALCAAVHVLVSMPFTESNERKAHTKYIHMCINRRFEHFSALLVSSLRQLNESFEFVVEFLLKSYLSITSSDWSIQAWDSTIQ